MRNRVAITDLTRMSGNKVCIAGYTPAYACVRPVFARGSDLTEPWLSNRRQVVIRPFAVVELDLLRSAPNPPHTEDWVIDAQYRRFVRMLDQDERLALLDKVHDASVDQIFGTDIRQNPGWYVISEQGTRSLGTIEPIELSKVFFYEQKGHNGDKWRYRLTFTDKAGEQFTLPVTDLAFQCFLTRSRLQPGGSAAAAAGKLLATLQEASKLYLRIGLTRGTWSQYPGHCFLQVTGVYSFPDYLDGRCFADLDPSNVRTNMPPKPFDGAL